MGDHAVNEPDLCQQLARWGHLVVNHTQTHYGLAWELKDRTDADVINDVVQAGVSIGAAANADSLLLGPPYLNWSEDVAAVLNGDPEARKFTGPIGSDIGGYDWQFWQDPTKTLNDCLQAYYNDITQFGSGIVTFHDDSQDPNSAALNRTSDLIQLLIPKLISDGFRFIRLDAAPQVRSAMQVSSIVGLKTSNGLYISPYNGGGGNIWANGAGIYAWEELGFVQLDSGQLAIRTPNGQFMSTQPSGEIVANGNGVYDWERFDLVDQGNPLIALKAWNGKYVTLLTSGQNAGQIWATVTGNPGSNESFTLETVA